MGIAKPVSSCTSNLLQLPVHSPSPSVHCLLSTGDSLLRPRWPCSPIRLQKVKASLFPISVIRSSRIKCLTKSTEGSKWSESETLSSDGHEAGDDDIKVEPRSQNNSSIQQHSDSTGSLRITTGSSSGSLSLEIREPIYEVVEVKSNGMVSTRKINRRHLLKSSGG